MSTQFLLYICLALSAGSPAMAQAQLSVNGLLGNSAASENSLAKLQTSEQTILTDFRADPIFFNSDKFEEVFDDSFTIPEQELPPVRSQGFANNCRDFCKAYLIQFRYCKERSLSENKINNCKYFSADGNQVSPIHIRIMSSPNPRDGQVGSQGVLYPISESVPGEWDYTIFNGNGSRLFFTDSCFPYDAFVNRFSNNQQLTDYFDDLRNRFQALKWQMKSQSAKPDSMGACSKCQELLKLISDTMPIEVELDTFIGALNRGTFEEFLAEVAFSESKRDKSLALKGYCGNIVLNKPAWLNSYPNLKFETTSKRDVLAAAMRLLKTRKEPLRIGGICMDRLAKDYTCGSHCMVLTGFKTVRNKANPTERKLLIRMLNSWGASWQKMSSHDGWIDADKLLANLNDLPRATEPSESETGAQKTGHQARHPQQAITGNIDPPVDSKVADAFKEEKKRYQSKKGPDEKGVSPAILSWLK